MSAKPRYQILATYRDDVRRHKQSRAQQPHVQWQCATCSSWIHAPQIKGLIARCRVCGTRNTVTKRQGYHGHEYWAVMVGGGKAPVDETAIFVALRQRHPDPEWVYLPQVRTQTGYAEASEVSGFDAVRYLDAFALNCYGSKGFRRVGYEIKISRSDFLRELEDPRKRAQGYFLCHEFWFAVAPGVYRPGDEVGVLIRGKQRSDPLDGCGVIEIGEDGTLTIIRKARAHDAWPMPTGFVASLLRAYVTARQAHWRQEVHESEGDTSEAEVLALPLWGVTEAAGE